MEDKKEYNLTVSPLWATQSGNFQRFIKDEEALNELKEAISQLHVGGKLLIKNVKEEYRNGEKSPHAYIEFITKEKVDEFNKQRETEAL